MLGRSGEAAEIRGPILFLRLFVFQLRHRTVSGRDGAGRAW